LAGIGLATREIGTLVPSAAARLPVFSAKSLGES